MTELLAFAERDIVQIDPDCAPTQFGGCLLVVTEVDVGSIVGYLPTWGMQTEGMVYIRMPVDRIKHTGGKAQWELPLP